MRSIGLAAHIRAEAWKVQVDRCDMLAEINAMEVLAIAYLPSEIDRIKLPWAGNRSDMKLCVVKWLN